MERWNAKLLLEANLILGEGPVWNPLWNEFLAIDIKGKMLVRFNADTGAHRFIPLGKMPGMVTPTADGKLLIAFQNSIEEYDLNLHKRVKLTSLESEKPDTRANDGACDARGRLWIGTMDVGARANRGALYRYDGSLVKMIDGLTVPNGLCWSPDDKTMYHIDSFAQAINAYDFDLDSGTISNGRAIVKFTGNALPDGMCSDSDGLLWVAIWGGGTVNRYDPVNGALTGQINVDAPLVTSCAFGGRNMKQLLITTATDGLTTQEQKKYPLSGSLFIVDLPVLGMPANSYASNQFNSYHETANC